MKFHSPVVFVKEIKCAKDFYCSCLKQEIEHDFDKSVIFKSGLSLWEVQPDHELKSVIAAPNQKKII